MFEIEMKAHVLDKEKLLKQLTKEYGKTLCSVKDDTYFKYNLLGATKNIRIRSSNIDTRLTFKEKSVIDGLEINEENETVISDPEVMEKLIIQMGGIKFFKKKKITHKFEWRDFVIECCDVNNIGTFLEIETVTESKEHAEEIKQQILTLFEKFEIDPQCIEERSYMELIKEKELVGMA